MSTSGGIRTVRRHALGAGLIAVVSSVAVVLVPTMAGAGSSSSLTKRGAATFTSGPVVVLAADHVPRLTTRAASAVTPPRSASGAGSAGASSGISVVPQATASRGSFVFPSPVVPGAGPVVPVSPVVPGAGPVVTPSGPAAGAVSADFHQVSPRLGNLFAQLRQLLAQLFVRLCARLGGSFCASA